MFPRFPRWSYCGVREQGQRSEGENLPSISSSPVAKRLLPSPPAYCSHPLLMLYSPFPRPPIPQLYPDELLRAITTPLFIAYASISIASIILLVNFSRTSYGDKWVMIDLGICALSVSRRISAPSSLASLQSETRVGAFGGPLPEEEVELTSATTAGRLHRALDQSLLLPPHPPLPRRLPLSYRLSCSPRPRLDRFRAGQLHKQSSATI